ncbi:hypothetical protein BCR37DRAFT_389581 [Protomyces lactucae-debilis]|uniref:Uncharacterized protein n=1 Tax=Protomyces lactucae-debilis TaxID=2754530 RepID=A0A1Y2EY81_PROLT|nr:uncharacterized protein BCR37DRAFT_389581 [Protomyces lactucae-debilis]ORY75755.1 hypothetical protein BCR37DRAFT_389581 [Protomyces lactucae-debilis]
MKLAILIFCSAAAALSCEEAQAQKYFKFAGLPDVKQRNFVCAPEAEKQFALSAKAIVDAMENSPNVQLYCTTKVQAASSCHLNKHIQRALVLVKDTDNIEREVHIWYTSWLPMNSDYYQVNFCSIHVGDVQGKSHKCSDCELRSQRADSASKDGIAMSHDSLVLFSNTYFQEPGDP